MAMEYKTLNNGIVMPTIGLGTFQIPKDQMNRVICQAYELGYRMFDTAWQYKNEGDLIAALRSNGIKREDVFLSTKCSPNALFYRGVHEGRKGWFDIRNFTSIRSAIMKSFDNLQTEYIDLFLIHWPWPIPIAQAFYVELTKLYKQGRIKAIGVCSSLPPHLNAFNDVSDVLPTVNQFEISPFNTQKQLIRYCQERRIICEAMSTFSHFRNTETRKDIVGNETIAPIAEKYGKSIPQVILRWLVQQGIVVIPKSANQARLKENISIFDFELSSDEMSTIDSLDKGHFLNYNPEVTITKPCWIRGRVPKKYRGWNGYDEKAK